jgi:hypothetical protein
MRSQIVYQLRRSSVGEGSGSIEAHEIGACRLRERHDPAMGSGDHECGDRELYREQGGGSDPNEPVIEPFSGSQPRDRVG